MQFYAPTKTHSIETFHIYQRLSNVSFKHQFNICDGSEIDSGSLRIDYKAFRKRKEKRICFIKKNKKANRKQFQQHLFPAFPLFICVENAVEKQFSDNFRIQMFWCFKLLNSNYLDCEKSSVFMRMSCKLQLFKAYELPSKFYFNQREKFRKFNIKTSFPFAKKNLMQQMFSTNVIYIYIW